ncbi:MAG TPA: glucosaminidase domain-containing protein [Prolixibacteraceae bacterium]|nr:glucosaminidase domain-containing protein [Prolixibacteraceae bacterium]
MRPHEFVKKYLLYAREIEDKTGLSAVAILAQAAVESSWGEAAPGNMFFGIKDTDGVNGNEQLITTTEYSRRPDEKFPVIISVKPVVVSGQTLYKYKVKDYFRRYETPAGSFADHAALFFRNKRYQQALAVRHDPEKFLIEIARAGYATDPEYISLLLKVVKMIQNEIAKHEKN